VKPIPKTTSKMSNKLSSNLAVSRSRILLFDTSQKAVNTVIETLEGNGIRCLSESQEVISIARSKLAQAKRILNRFCVDYSII
jgi:hypothetical protein